MGKEHVGQWLTNPKEDPFSTWAITLATLLAAEAVGDADSSHFVGGARKLCGLTSASLIKRIVLIQSLP